MIIPLSKLVDSNHAKIVPMDKTFLDSYTKAIHEAFDSALRLKLLTQMVTTRKGLVDIGGDGYGVFEAIYVGFPLIGSNAGFPVMLRQDYVQQAEIERIKQELLS